MTAHPRHASPDTWAGGPDEPGRSCRWWTAILALLAAIVLVHLAAGLLLAGTGWARAAHSANAVVLVTSMIIAGPVALVAPGQRRNGRRLGLALLSIALLVFAQAAFGADASAGSEASPARPLLRAA